MKRTVILIIISALFIFPSVVPAKTQGVPGQTHNMKAGPVRDVDMMTGMMTDIDRLLNRENITMQQRRQVMKIMGEMGAVMQRIGSAGETEGWMQSKERGRITLLRKQLDMLKKQIEGNKK